MVDAIDRLLFATAFAGGAYLTWHGFTKDSVMDTEVTGIMGMVAAGVIYLYAEQEEDIGILIGAINKLKSGYIHDDLGWKAPEVPK